MDLSEECLIRATNRVSTECKALPKKPEISHGCRVEILFQYVSICVTRREISTYCVVVLSVVVL